VLAWLRPARLGRALPLLTRQVPVMPALASQKPMPQVQVQVRAPSMPPPALPLPLLAA